MHLYKKIPKGTNYVFPTESFTLSNSDNDALIRINVSLVITIPLNLKPDFFCQIKVFAGVSVRVEYEAGVNVEAQEGFFIEGGQTFTIMGNGLTANDNNFEVIRNRPVNIDNWTKVVKTNNPYYGAKQYSLEGDIRLMLDGAILGEYPQGYQFTQADLDQAGAGIPVEIWYSKNYGVSGGGAWIYCEEAYFQDVDWAHANNRNKAVKIRYSNLITGVALLPSDFTLTLGSCDYYETALAIGNFNGKVLDIQGAVNTEVPQVIEFSDKPNLEKLSASIFYNNGDFTIRNNPKLTYIYNYSNSSLNTPQNLIIENCPLLDYVKITTYQETTAPQKNIDQILIDLDNNGVLNGTWWTSMDYVYTAASDAARANLAAKGWFLQFTRV